MLGCKSKSFQFEMVSKPGFTPRSERRSTSVGRFAPEYNLTVAQRRSPRTPGLTTASSSQTLSRRAAPEPTSASRAKLFASSARNPLRRHAIRTNSALPNTHVPVVVCRSAGIWTRGQSTALGRPAAGGEPANPAQRGTRLEATTDRAFLVSVGPPKVDVQRGLSFLPGVRTGHSLVQTMALIA